MMREYNQDVQLTVQNKLSSVQALNLAKEIILNEFDMASGDYTINPEGLLLCVDSEGLETILRPATDTDKAIFILMKGISSKLDDYAKPT